MAKKIKKSLTRLELADYLADLSRQLRGGCLEAEGCAWTVPEQLVVKVHFREEDGEVRGKISWRWPAAETPEVLKPPEAGEAAPREPDSFKEVKIRMAAAFKELQRLIGEGQFPADRLLGDFLKDSRSFAAMAPVAWREPAGEFLAHLEAFQGAVADRRLETTQQELQVLVNDMIICHREFKK